MKKKPKSTDDIGNVIVVDNVPEVGADKQEKLKNIIMKLFSKFGKVVNVYYAVNGEGVTSGYVFGQALILPVSVFVYLVNFMFH